MSEFDKSRRDLLITGVKAVAAGTVLGAYLRHVFESGNDQGAILSPERQEMQNILGIAETRIQDSRAVSITGIDKPSNQTGIKKLIALRDNKSIAILDITAVHDSRQVIQGGVVMYSVDTTTGTLEAIDIEFDESLPQPVSFNTFTTPLGTSQVRGIANGEYPVDRESLTGQNGYTGRTYSNPPDNYKRLTNQQVARQQDILATAQVDTNLTAAITNQLTEYIAIQDLNNLNTTNALCSPDVANPVIQNLFTRIQDGLSHATTENPLTIRLQAQREGAFPPEQQALILQGLQQVPERLLGTGGYTLKETRGGVVLGTTRALGLKSNGNLLILNADYFVDNVAYGDISVYRLDPANRTLQAMSMLHRTAQTGVQGIMCQAEGLSEEQVADWLTGTDLLPGLKEGRPQLWYEPLTPTQMHDILNEVRTATVNHDLTEWLRATSLDKSHEYDYQVTTEIDPGEHFRTQQAAMMSQAGINGKFITPWPDFFFTMNGTPQGPDATDPIVVLLQNNTRARVNIGRV